MPHILGLLSLEHSTWYPLSGRLGYLSCSYGSVQLVIVGLREREQL